MDTDITKKSTRHIPEPGRRYNPTRQVRRMGSEVSHPRRVQPIAAPTVSTLKPSIPRKVAAVKPALPRTKRSMVLRRQMVEKAEIHRKQTKKIKKLHFAASLLVLIVVGSLGAVIWTFKDTIPFTRDIFRETPAFSNAIDSDPEEISTLDERKPDLTEMSAQLVAPDAPKILRIPRLNTEARIVPVGTTLTNEPISPKNIFDIGWYDKSGKPGTPGAAVLLNGHIAGPTLPGVFAQVASLVAGDKLELERGDGQKLIYTVTRVQEYSSAQLDMSAATNPIDTSKQGLNLVTTMTKFSGAQKRVIVFAVM